MLRFTLHAFVTAMMLTLSATAIQADEFEAIDAPTVEDGQVAANVKTQMKTSYAEQHDGQTLAAAVGAENEDDIVFKVLKVSGNTEVGFVATSAVADAAEFRFNRDGNIGAAAEPFQLSSGNNSTIKKAGTESPVVATLAATWKQAKNKTRKAGALWYQVTPYGFIISDKKASVSSRDSVYASAAGAWANKDLVLRGLDMPVTDKATLPADVQEALATDLSNSNFTTFVTPWGYRVRNAGGVDKWYDHAGEQVTGTKTEKAAWLEALPADATSPVGYLAKYLADNQ